MRKPDEQLADALKIIRIARDLKDTAPKGAVNALDEIIERALHLTYDFEEVIKQQRDAKPFYPPERTVITVYPDGRTEIAIGTQE